MKPGFTYFRLFVFLVVAGTLSVVALNVATTSPPPRSDCDAKGIDPRGLEEGTCTRGESTVVVVNRHSTLRLETLEARLLTVRYRKIPAATSASSAAGERLITFDVSVKNLTDGPASVDAGLFLLDADKPWSEDEEFEKGHEPRSFLTRDQDIAPERTVEGTVTFRVSSVAARAVRKEGNLDVANLGDSASSRGRESIFSRPEYGVIRTYH